MAADPLLPPLSVALDRVADLNCRYGSPLQDAAEVARYYHLVGGHPYLVRYALYLDQALRSG